MKNIFTKGFAKFLILTLFLSLFITNSASATTYTVTVSASSGGSVVRGAGTTPVSTNGGTYTFNSGYSTTFTVTSNSGYYISSLNVDGSPVGTTSQPCGYHYGSGPYYPGFSNASANHTIDVTFSLKPTVNATATAGGSISPAGNTSYDYCFSQYYSVTPNAGYYISDVTLDGSSQGAITGYALYNIITNHTISAIFNAAVPVVTLTVDANSVKYNNNTIIRWTVTNNPTSCTGTWRGKDINGNTSGSFTASSSPTGNYYTTPSLSSTTTFSVTCSI